jgi:hypothetical protein
MVAFLCNGGRERLAWLRTKYALDEDFERNKNNKR